MFDGVFLNHLQLVSCNYRYQEGIVFLLRPNLHLLICPLTNLYVLKSLMGDYLRKSFYYLLYMYGQLNVKSWTFSANYFKNKRKNPAQAVKPKRENPFLLLYSEINSANVSFLSD